MLHKNDSPNFNRDIDMFPPATKYMVIEEILNFNMSSYC